MKKDSVIVISQSDRRFVIKAAHKGGPRLVFWGPSTVYEAHPEPTHPALPSSADIRIEKELFPLEGKGFHGEPALLAYKTNKCVFDFELTSTDQTDSSVVLSYFDKSNLVELTLNYEIDESGVLLSNATLRNEGAAPLYLQRLNALSLPLPRWIDTADLTFGGWSSEGHNERIPLNAGKVERTSRSGRPGFDGGPHMVLTEQTTNETTGLAFGVALANSGNFTVAAERMGHGEAQTFAAEWLHPGEIQLSPGGIYESPKAITAISARGLSHVSAQFHAYARRIAPATQRQRPVQLNSWEAAYFSVDESSAMRLASAAAEIGAERFVLDDGWFKGRCNDKCVLGDWAPDPDKFPNGLGPLSNHVARLGMEFGLWVEPEMVSEDSDLFREHPDWILSVDGKPGPTGRNQLVLNLTRQDVRDHLFSQLNDLLTQIDIRYLKWDCNRDLFPAATTEGSAAHKQIAGLYELLGRIRTAHPKIAIESCASGGGRIDFGVLRYADRFWTSDSTDPIERVRIQKRASLFYPAEMLGAHVGASPNHWTGRQTTMAFRCLVAFFGHFGVELDPSILNDYDRNVLKRAISLFKNYRDILTDGTLMRFDDSDAGLDIQISLATDHSHALLRVLRTEEPKRQSLAPIRLPGLPAQTRWRLTELVIEGADKENSMGEYSSEWLGFSGIEINPQHAGQGQLFLMEKI